MKVNWLTGAMIVTSNVSQTDMVAKTALDCLNEVITLQKIEKALFRGFAYTN